MIRGISIPVEKELITNNKKPRRIEGAITAQNASIDDPRYFFISTTLSNKRINRIRTGDDSMSYFFINASH